jgi:DNA-binding NtrC family response regulator
MEERGVCKSARNIRVLVIEDDLEIQSLVQAFFQPRGYFLSFFNEAQECLTAITQHNLQADVIITDLNLPGMQGTELITRLRQAGLQQPVILITAQSSIQAACDAIQAGAFDFIVKPMNLQQLEISTQRAVQFKEILKENVTLKENLKQQIGESNESIICKSQGFKGAMDLARRVSNSWATVLITGESGTGKEVIARATHNLGERQQGPFIAINCSAIPESLLEAELFGYAKGAFTGASDKKEGLFEEANGGTLFLDEIGDLSLPLQAKLLRVLQEGKIKRIGENKMRDIQVRIVAATHKDLRAEIRAQKFREDLFFRLHVIPIHIPPLRDRKEDIIPLAEFFLRKFSSQNSSQPKKLSKEAFGFLLKHTWPGNVRELENMIERAVVLSENEMISLQDLLFETSQSESQSESFMDRSRFGSGESSAAMENFVPPGMPVEEVLKKHILMTLHHNGGSREKTAKMLRIDRKTLYRKLLQYGYNSGPSQQM